MSLFPRNQFDWIHKNRDIKSSELCANSSTQRLLVKTSIKLKVVVFNTNSAILTSSLLFFIFFRKKFFFNFFSQNILMLPQKIRFQNSSTKKCIPKNILNIPFSKNTFSKLLNQKIHFKKYFENCSHKKQISKIHFQNSSLKKYIFQILF